MKTVGCLCLCWMSVSGSLFASMMPPQTEELLESHLTFVSLATGDTSFDTGKMLLASGSDNDIQAGLPDIEQDIADFWLRQGISLPYVSLAANEPVEIRVRSLMPPEPSYLRVMSQIRHLLRIEANYAWPPLALERLLRPGEQHEKLTAIALRLWLLGDLPQKWRGLALYDDVLATAIRVFQERHGLKADGIIGPLTLSWLNVGPHMRAKLLVQNFIAKSQQLSSLESRYMLVNIPAFELLFVDDGQVLIRSRVIVGKPYRPTPVLDATISNVVVNPSWRVPRSIVRQDLLPQLIKNGDYLNERQFEVFDYQQNKIERSAQEWQSEAMGRFPYVLVQKPGKLNALGRYKLYFSNSFDVYLHDTPDKHLFEQPERALSSGCIRVEKIDEIVDWFAENLVPDKRTWHRTQTQDSRTQWFSLSSTVPIHLVYWTAWVDENYRAQFRTDIYNRFSGSENPEMAMK
jgi:L,D-transpeptidase YcbB